MSNLATAISLAAQQFEGVCDKGGQPYILHCLHVMNNVDQTDHELMTIAVLHDVVEDTGVTFTDLKHMFMFSDRVIDALKLLTHSPKDSYDDYILGMMHNQDAIKVKMADLTHNSQLFRMKGLREKDFERIAKYHKAYACLSAWLK